MNDTATARPTVVGMTVDPTTYADATARILALAAEGRPRRVCAANVHMAMACRDDAAVRAAVNGADLVTPDGMPLKWMLGLLGHPLPDRVSGPHLSMQVCAAAAEQGVPVGFYGGHASALPVLTQRLTERFPRLHIAYAWAPPFRPLTDDEDRRERERIIASGVRILFVGLGCPKQELWMAVHADLPCVMLGVGAFFDFAAGRVRQAPAWMQRLGLEWLFRLLMEPRRLWRRYLWNNPRFVWLAMGQVLRRKR